MGDKIWFLHKKKKNVVLKEHTSELTIQGNILSVVKE